MGSMQLRAVAVVSGGLDSVTLAYLLKEEGLSLDIVSFNYGQRHDKELRFAQAVARKLGASWTLVNLAASGIANLLRGSALTDPRVEVPDGHYASDTMLSTVVPNRNAIMLAIAYAGASSWGAEIVAIAVHSGDHPIYADCRPEFVAAFQSMELIALGRADGPELRAPFLSKSKAEIVAVGAALRVPFDQTWSCYKGGDTHCGSCGTCYERREAFKLAGVLDPTVYESEPEFVAP